MERFADFNSCDKHVMIHHSEKSVTNASNIVPKNLPVKDLKLYLKERNQSVSGSKKILIHRLEGILSSEQ